MADIEKVIKEAEEELKSLLPDDVHRLHMGIMMKLGWIYDVLELLKEQQQIVLCKDCKYNTGHCRGLYSAFVTCYKTGTPHKEDWYCADGKRAE